MIIARNTYIHVHAHAHTHRHSKAPHLDKEANEAHHEEARPCAQADLLKLLPVGGAGETWEGRVVAAAKREGSELGRARGEGRGHCGLAV